MVVLVMPMSLSISAKTIPFCSSQSPCSCPVCTRLPSHAAAFTPGSYTAPFSLHLRRTAHTQLAGMKGDRWGGGNVHSVSLELRVSTLCPGEGNGTPLQYSCLENPMDGGAGWLQSIGSRESDTTERLHFHFSVSCIGEINGNPLQCSCLENPKDGGAWWAAVYGVDRKSVV